MSARKISGMLAATALAVTLTAAWWVSTSASAVGAQSANAVSPRAAVPAAVQSKINGLNNALDRCLVGHGAQRVGLPAGGWTYTDPEGVPSAACATVQAQVNAYADSAEYRAAAAAAMQASQQYANCLARHGVGAVHGARTPDEQKALVAAHIACGGTAQNAVAAG